MSKHPSDNRDLDAKAIGTLMAAQSAPFGPEQTEALKEADRLRQAADTYNYLFSRELKSPE
jgi:hypothetical protein